MSLPHKGARTVSAHGCQPSLLERTQVRRLPVAGHHPVPPERQLAPTAVQVQKAGSTPCLPDLHMHTAGHATRTGRDAHGDGRHAAVVERDVARHHAAQRVNDGRLADRGRRVGVAKHLRARACGGGAGRGRDGRLFRCGAPSAHVRATQTQSIGLPKQMRDCWFCQR